MGLVRGSLGSSLSEVSMAKIIWRKRPLQLLDYYIGNASEEFGQSTARKWAEDVEAFEDRVKRYPLSYPPERLLRGKEKAFRQCHIMNRRFKIIYFYDEVKDAVTVMDIWDTRMNPKTLVHRIH